MSKFGLYTRNYNETSSYIFTCDMPNIDHAKAYFAGLKQLSLEEFQNLFIVKEIKDTNKTLIYGNR
jgi:hypothetical protein